MGDHFDFMRVQINPDSVSPEVMLDKFGGTWEEAIRRSLQALSDDVFVSSTFQVAVSRPFFPRDDRWPNMLHLSITRLDQAPIHDWGALQRIKNIIVGPEFEAIEVYPAESRKVDMGNNYHLWVFPLGYQVPIGWETRMVKGE
jgi:hypothetical protein